MVLSLSIYLYITQAVWCSVILCLHNAKTACRYNPTDDVVCVNCHLWHCPLSSNGNVLKRSFDRFPSMKKSLRPLMAVDLVCQRRRRWRQAGAQRRKISSVTRFFRVARRYVFWLVEPRQCAALRHCCVTANICNAFRSFAHGETESIASVISKVKNAFSLPKYFILAQGVFNACDTNTRGR